MSRRSSLAVAAVAALVCLSSGPARVAAEEKEAGGEGASILRDLRRLGNTGTVLYVAAHPDDENTQLITYFARGRGYRTAYLSLTRGDGGQNVIGGEFGEQLGLIRTHELLEARKLDGGRQFFTRAVDFGFSKDYQETLRIWNRREVLSDVVRVIRTFRPDVIVTRFSPEPGGTHGHHTASAVLALEAFKLAGDEKAFPEQLAQGLGPWQAKRILQNGRGGGQIQIDVSGTDPVTGETFSRVAARSRGMHKSQGFGFFGASSDRAVRPESFQVLAGEAAERDPMEGVETTWARVPGGEAVGGAIEAIIKGFDAKDPGASVPALLEVRKQMAGLAEGDPLVAEKRGDLDRILQACLGLSVETTTPRAEVVPGETIQLHHVVTVGSAHPVKWVGTRYPGGAQRGVTVELKVGEPVSRDAELALSKEMALTQPYWLRKDGADGISAVEDPGLIGMPENPPAIPLEHVFEVGGQTLVVAGEPVSGEQKRRVEVVPPVSLRPVTEVRLFAPGESKGVEVEVTATRGGAEGTVGLEAPAGWKVEPASQAFRLGAAGEKGTAKFTVTAPAGAGGAVLNAKATVGGAEYHTGRFEIRYGHIPPLLLQPPARVKAVALDLATRGEAVGYLPGAGDAGAEALEQMGYKVKRLTPADLTAEGLKGLDAVVVGVRAFNVRPELTDGAAALFGFAEAGGTVIVQYNRPDGLKAKPAPFDVRVANLRVTDEGAPVSFLKPEHPVLNVPNKITHADFDGWVQERGLYFPGEWDTRFVPILAMNDPASEPLHGSLLVAGHGKGHVVYTGLAFFRQLPAGVPGAYRLFANLVSLGKD